MISQQLHRDFDANAATLGLTPKLDREGRVIAIGVPEEPDLPDNKRRYYIVWIGRAIGIYHNWYAAYLACRSYVI